MAEIRNLVLCEDIQNQLVLQDGADTPVLQPNIVSPLTAISPVSVPGNYSFAMFGAVSDFDGEKINEMVISIKSPNGTECFTTGVIKVVKPADIKFNQFNFALNFRNFVFKIEGNYKISILFNQSEIFTREFEVKAKGV